MVQWWHTIAVINYFGVYHNSIKLMIFVYLSLGVRLSFRIYKQVLILLSLLSPKQATRGKVCMVKGQ